MTKRKEKEVEEKEYKTNTYFQNAVDTEPNEQAKSEPKPNKKLIALWDELAAKWNVLNKFLTEQGLGQNARRKVVEFVKEIDAVKDKIKKEEE